MLAQGIVAARLDYCLQVTQNVLAMAVCSAPWSTSATELHRSLHWLPVREHVDYKLALITFKARRTGCPVYIASLLNEYRPTRTLHSFDGLLFTIPFCRLSLGNQAFSVNAPRVWNILMHDCRAISSIACFKCNLKTELFNVACLV